MIETFLCVYVVVRVLYDYMSVRCCWTTQHTSLHPMTTSLSVSVIRHLLFQDSNVLLFLADSIPMLSCGLDVMFSHRHPVVFSCSDYDVLEASSDGESGADDEGKDPDVTVQEVKRTARIRKECPGSCVVQTTSCLTRMCSGY